MRSYVYKAELLKYHEEELKNFGIDVEYGTQGRDCNPIQDFILNI
jgi:hypothetical protein